MITPLDIIKILRAAGVEQPIDGWFGGWDTQYDCPTRDWVVNEFSDGLRVMLPQVGLTGGSGEARDCDDYADFAQFYASMLHRKMGFQHAVAFGKWAFLADISKGHVMNFFIVKEGSVHVPCWYEPQKAKIVEATPDMKTLCVRYDI